MTSDWPKPYWRRLAWCMWQVWDDHNGYYHGCHKRARWVGRGERKACGEHKYMLFEFRNDLTDARALI